MEALRWTSQDLEFFPDNGKLYEIVNGELYVSKQPHLYHQVVCTKVASLLEQWSNRTQLGLTIFSPGVIFADDDDVVPDVVWISYERLAIAFEEDGKLHSSPELVIEVLSPGSMNKRRDREVKLKLYSLRGAKEYWIINWQERSLEVYQRVNALLTLDRTLDETDILQSPLLPEFSCRVSAIFSGTFRPTS
ncbi:MAG: Uma2 family endonuclease [Chloroflexi bacterium]|nr:Uma2 family endonuclease [Ktedonobacteraceae bacterium]MBV9022183.1 Uma2 family endonuclease [Ktedonobacteraceae bacterium]MBV9706020.1 Uma2 family endonuclease [Chloroflexota bacterium]